MLSHELPLSQSLSAPLDSKNRTKCQRIPMIFTANGLGYDQSRPRRIAPDERQELIDAKHAD